MPWGKKPEQTEQQSFQKELFRQKYEGLKNLFNKNSELIEIISDLEADLRHATPDDVSLYDSIFYLSDGTLLLIEDLNKLTNNRFVKLYNSHDIIQQDILGYINSFKTNDTRALSYLLKDIDITYLSEVGGKAANLAELLPVLPDNIPYGFIITTNAYRLFLRENELYKNIKKLLINIDVIIDKQVFQSRTQEIRDLIQNAIVPQQIIDEINNKIVENPDCLYWAVRSSAVGEDSELTFAGQFESLLNVNVSKLVDAYKSIITSRYSDRALMYRLVSGFSEVETPMAVLFLPMLDAESAGVLYTRDPQEPDNIVISSVWGLAANLVSGEESCADVFYINRESNKLIKELIATKNNELTINNSYELTKKEVPFEKKELSSISFDKFNELIKYGLIAEKLFGNSQDIEWVLDKNGKIWIVQSRFLYTKNKPDDVSCVCTEKNPLLFSGGMTIFHGRAAGEVYIVSSINDIINVPEGKIVVIHQAVPELSTILPKIAGLIAEHGNLTGHAASLIREFNVPCIFGLQNALEKFKNGQYIGLDATYRKIFEGNPWPEIRTRVKSRIRHSGDKVTSLLHNRIFKLNLIDPVSESFNSASCKSLHDIIRFVHEKAVEAMFNVGDYETQKYGKNVKMLKSDIPFNIVLLDINNAIKESLKNKKEVTPQEINSVPFQALWSGMTHKDIHWGGRSNVSLQGFSSVLLNSMVGDVGEMRNLGDLNYMIVAPEYLNLNARLAYHYTTIDAFISDTPENNYINFRFWGGGATRDRRDLRARFLSEILLRSNFCVDRRKDLLTAWLRRYSKEDCIKSLELLGKLSACARQLDMLINNEEELYIFVEHFLKGNYNVFA